MNTHQTVTCPYDWCAAKPGEPCKDRRGIPMTYQYQHPVREVAAVDAALLTRALGSLGGGEHD